MRELMTFSVAWYSLEKSLKKIVCLKMTTRSNVYGTQSKVSTATQPTASHTSGQEFVETLITIPPDGGWGWVIVAASFVCFFVTDGIMYTFGIFLNELSNNFGVHQTEIAMAVGILTGLNFLCGSNFYLLLYKECEIAGPFVCAFINQCGFKAVAFWGGIVLFLAYLTSTYMKKTYLFLIYHGMFGGLGLSLIYVPTLLIVPFYFEKRRAVAVSLSTCGSSMGIIGYPLIIKGIEDSNWKKKFHYVSLFGCMCAFCALFYKSLRPIMIGPRNDIILPPLPQQQLKNKRFPTISQLIDGSANYGYAPNQGSTSAASSSVVINTTNYQTIQTQEAISFESSEPKGADKTGVRPGCCRSDRKQPDGSATHRWFKCTKRSRAPLGRPMYRDDISYGSSLNRLKSFNEASLEAYRLSVTRPTTVEEQKEKCTCCTIAMRRTLATMLDFKLLRYGSFLLLSISSFMNFLGLYIPFIFIIQRSEEKNVVPRFTLEYISVLGASNLIGLIISATAMFNPKTDIIAMAYISLTVSGLSTVGIVFLTDVYSHFSYCIIYGASIAPIPLVRGAIMVELLGLENLTNGFGILMLFQGIGCLISVPVARILYQLIGSYDACFLFAGSSITLSAVLMIPLRKLSKSQK